MANNTGYFLQQMGINEFCVDIEKDEVIRPVLTDAQKATLANLKATQNDWVNLRNRRNLRRTTNSVRSKTQNDQKLNLLCCYLKSI